MMNVTEFQKLISGLTREIAALPLDAALESHLNGDYPPGSALYDSLFEACRIGVRDGWLCNRSGGGIRYGRVIKPSDATDGFSVDVVDMADCAGPHHSHPNGEIDLIMPLSDGACFDNHPAGWRVYAPGTAHFPTVSKGQALVLYLLPQGAIHFTATATT